MDLPGVPETITREQYTQLIAVTGLDPNELERLEFRADGIYATVYALNEDGRRFIDQATERPTMHRVFIRVTA